MSEYDSELVVGPSSISAHTVRALFGSLLSPVIGFWLTCRIPMYLAGQMQYLTNAARNSYLSRHLRD